MKKIVIVEDDRTLAEELSELLVNSGYETVCISCFEHTKEDILMAKGDLVLLDINIPGINGELVLKELRKESNIPVIMVTSRTDVTDEVLSMSYGADDYVTKPYNPTVLLLRISAILKRTEQSSGGYVYRNFTVNPSKGILVRGEESLPLTKNEMIIFQFLLDRRGQIVSRDELITDLWENNEFVNDNALTVNISRLRSKLADFGCKNAIETRKKQGYILL